MVGPGGRSSRSPVLSEAWASVPSEPGNRARVPEPESEERLMDRVGIIAIVDEALEAFATRELVRGSEVVDVLLDLRSVLVSDAEIQALLESEAQPTA